MSVILDVLRKLDREKSSRRSAAADIALEILKPDPPRSTKRSALYFAAIGLTALVTAAITYTLMGSGSLSKPPAPGLMKPPAAGREVAQAPLASGSPSISSLPPAKSPPVSSQEAAPALPPPDQPKSPAASAQKVTPALPPPESSRDNRSKISRVPQEIRTPAYSKTPAISPSEKETSRNVISEKASVAPRTAEELIEKTPTPPQAIPERPADALPALKISAIIWYEDPSSRFAMINDTMTHEGSLIETVKVEEIHPNRVRFSHKGRYFEISVK